MRPAWPLAAILIVIFACGGDSHEGLPGVESVLLISIDTLRPDYLGTYDPSRTTSPRIDRFAGDSLVFLDALAQGPGTAISHKSILYSLYPAIHKTGVNSVPNEDITSPIEELRSLGFATAAFVGGGQLHPAFGFDKGFDSYVVATKGLEHPLQRLRQSSLDWLESHRDDPFFLFVHTYQVHGPYDPPEPYRSKYAGWYQGDLDPSEKGWRKIYDRERLEDDGVQLIRDLYAAQVEYVDNFIGELFAGLQELGLWDSTLIVLLSDHGQSLGENGIWGHGKLHEIQLHIPLIVRIPGLEGSRIDAPVEAVDVMPTIFAALGAEPPYALQGQNLLPHLLAHEPWDAERVRIAQKGRRTSIRDRHWKVVVDRRGEERRRILELVDGEEIPWEGDDPQAIARLQAAYEEMIRSGRELASRFTANRDYDPSANRDARNQLRALGYVN